MSPQNPQAGPPAPDPSADPAAKPAPAGFGRRRKMLRLAVVFASVGVLWAGYWLFFQKGLEATDNAYIAGNQVRVTPLVGGTVREILTDNTEMVEAGQVVVRLDPTDAFLNLEKARSDLASVVRAQAGLMAERDRLRAVIEMRLKELDLSRSDYERRLKLRSGVSITEEEVNTHRERTAIAEAALAAARHELEATDRLLADTPLADQPAVRLSADRLREVWLAWRRCEIKSPVGGRVARRTVQVGARVEPGAALMAVVPADEIWVEANFKEVQLRHMKVGQPVRLTVDLIGGGRVLRGRVAGVSPGTGGVFSLLPPENATGNWIKVVQRVPVKIAFEDRPGPDSPLALGLSCRVEVEVGHPGQAPADPPPGARYLTRSLDENLELIDREIETIIRANAFSARAGRPAGL